MSYSFENAVVLLVHQLPVHLRMSREPSLGADVEPVRRAFVVVVKIAGLVPVVQAQVEVGRELQVVGAGLGADTGDVVVDLMQPLRPAISSVHVSMSIPVFATLILKIMLAYMNLPGG